MTHLQTIKEFSAVNLGLIFIGVAFMLFVCCTQYEIGEGPKAELEEILGKATILGNGHVKAFVKVDESQNLTSIGVRISETALDEIQVTKQHSFSYLIDLPEVEGFAPFDHIALDWIFNEQNSQDIKPTHLGVQFYTIMLAERLLITEDEENPHADAALIPKNYSPSRETKEGAGTYWTDMNIVKNEEIDYNHSVLYGSHSGELTFVAPTVSIDFLRSKKAIHSSVSSAVELGKTEFSYEEYVVYFDEQTREYIVSILF